MIFEIIYPPLLKLSQKNLLELKLSKEQVLHVLWIIQTYFFYPIQDSLDQYS